MYFNFVALLLRTKMYNTCWQFERYGNMKIKELILISITATTLTTLAIVVTQTGKELPSFNKVFASEKSFTFDQGVGNAYWSSNVDDEKTIAPALDRGAISARTNIVTWGNKHGFGVQNDCFYWTDYPVNDNDNDSKTTLAVGVNNLQSFSFSFHLLPLVEKQNSTSYRATVRFFGEDYDVNKCINNPDSKDELYEEGEFSSNTVINDHHYTHTWTKPDQNHVIRYALFEIKIFSTAVSSSGGYCALFLDSITVTWNC